MLFRVKRKCGDSAVASESDDVNGAIRAVLLVPPGGSAGLPDVTTSPLWFSLSRSASSSA